MTARRKQQRCNVRPHLPATSTIISHYSSVLKTLWAFLHPVHNELLKRICLSSNQSRRIC